MSADAPSRRPGRPGPGPAGRASRLRRLGPAAAGLAGLLALLALAQWGDAVALVAALIGGTITVAVVRPRSAFALALVVAFVLRLGLAVIDTHAGPLPGAGADSVRFEQTALAWSDDHVPLSERFRTGSLLMSWLAAHLYRLTAPSALAVKAVLALLGTLTVWNVARLTYDLWGRAAAVRAAWLTTLYPTLALFSGIFLREAPLAYLASLGALHTVRGLERRGVAHFVLATAAFVTAAAFHTGMVALLPGLLVVVVGDAVVGVARSERKRWVRGAVVAAAAVVALGAMAATGWGFQKLGPSLQGATLSRVAAYQASAARGDAAYLEGVTPDGPLDLVWQAPVRLAFLLLTPFPWMVREPGHLLALVDAVLVLVLLIGVWRERRRILARPGRLALLVLFLAVSTAYALGTSNFGTAVRHRAKLVPLLIPLVATLPWERRHGSDWAVMMPADADERTSRRTHRRRRTRLRRLARRLGAREGLSRDRRLRRRRP